MKGLEKYTWNDPRLLSDKLDYDMPQELINTLQNYVKSEERLKDYEHLSQLNPSVLIDTMLSLTQQCVIEQTPIKETVLRNLAFHRAIFISSTTQSEKDWNYAWYWRYMALWRIIEPINANGYY